jgi:hypothetical protein
MTPKEKALDIFNKMCKSVYELFPSDVKDCALIAVDEIIEYSKEWDDDSYWQEVKQEIEKL